MILISHDLGVIAQICDSVAVMYAGEIIESGTVEDIFDFDEEDESQKSGGHHPYTTGLFGAIPDMSRKTKRLSPIDGLMVDPTTLLPGCRFEERCPRRTDICGTQPPEMKKVKNDTHSVRCHLFELTEVSL
jgi:peptide/nickel transport system ATP-binding protein